MISATLLLLLSQTQGLDTPVTLDVANASLPSVARKLEEIGGIKIRIQGAPERDWIYLSVKERPLRQVLDGLAQLCDARWVSNDSGVTLSAPWPSPDLQQTLREQQIAEWLDKNPVPPAMNSERAEKAITRAIELSESQLPNRYAEMDKVNLSLPYSRAVLRVLHGLGPKALSEIKPGEERIYSPKRQGRAHPMPASLSGILPEVHQECKVVENQLLLMGLTYENAEARNQLPYPFIFYFDEASIDRFWCVSITNQNSDLAVKFRGFGGEYLVQRMETCTYIPFNIEEEAKEDGLTTLKQPFVFSKEWTASLTPQGMRADFANRDIDAATQHLPAAIKAAQTMLKGDMMAVIPDGAYVWASLQNERTYDLGMVLRKSMQQPCRLTVGQGLALLRPIDLAKSRASRIPREALADYIDSDEKGSLDAVADLAQATDNDESYWHTFAILGMSELAPRGFYESPDLLRIYGGLSEANRERAKQDGLMISFSNLSKAQQACVDRMMNFPGAGLDPGSSIPAVSASTYYSNNVSSDIKLNLPPTLPGSTPVLIRVGRVSSYFAYLENDPDIGVFQTSASSLAYFKVYMAERYGKVSKFAPAELTYLQVAVDAAPLGRFARASSPQGIPEKNHKWVGLGDLPQAFQDEYKRQYEAHLRQKNRPG